MKALTEWHLFLALEKKLCNTSQFFLTLTFFFLGQLDATGKSASVEITKL